MSAPSDAPSVPAAAAAPPAPSPAPGAEPSPRPVSGGRPPASPAVATPRAGRRSVDGGRSIDGGRRSVDGSGRRGRHTVEVPENAERHEGLVVSRQEKFGFIKCTNHEGRYFFHVNDSDGLTAYGATVSFVIARDLTTGKDVAYHVKTLTPPASSSPAPAGAGSARNSRSTTPDRLAQAAAVAAAEGSGFYSSPAPAAGEGGSNGAAEGGSGAASGGGGPGGPQMPLPVPVSQQGSGGQFPGGQQYQGQQYQQYHHGPQHGQRRQHGQQHGGEGGGQFGGQYGGGGRGGYDRFSPHHRQPSPASQGDWRVARDANQAAQAAGMAAGPGQGGPSGPGSVPVSRHNSGAPSSSAPSAADSAFGAAGEPAAPARYRGTVAQPARAARHHAMDDGLLLYIDEQGAQQQARYGNCRLVEGTGRLEPGDVVEFELGSYPGAGPGHRKVASEVRFLSKSLLPTPSLEAALAANEAGDSLRGRQLGRVALLKKEFGFIRQMDRPGDMFFHFSQLEGWGPDDVKVGDDVEYTIRRDRDGTKLSAVQIRRAPPGAVQFETVSEELHRGVVLERPQLGKQYMGTSGVLEYAPPEVEGGAPPMPGLPAPPGSEAAVPGMPGFGKARLPFSPQDVMPGSGSMRVGDHVSFRLLTNLQAAKAAALASVPGAAAYAGKRAVEVSFVRYAGTVVLVNKERQFGFISYSEDQLLPPPAPRPAGAPAEAGGMPGTDGGEPAATAAGGEGEAAPAAAAGEAAAPAEGAAAPALEGGEAAAPAPAAEASAGSAAASEGLAAVASEVSAVSAGAGEEGAAGEAGAEAPAVGAAAAAAAPATPQAKPNRIFFHFKEVAGQYILKPGDEVVFVLHTNLKSGELNAQRVKRTKEGPELPPPPEPAPRPAPVPAVNPNRFKYSGNLSGDTYKQPKIARGPDGTRGFELARPNAVMPPLPGLEPKPEPEPEEAMEEGQEGAEGQAGPAAPPGLAAPAAAAAAAAQAAAAQAMAPGLSLAHNEAHAAHAAAVRTASLPVRVVVPAAAPVAAGGGGAAAAEEEEEEGPEEHLGSPSGWQGATPFSALAAMTLADATVVEAKLSQHKPHGSAHLSTHLSAEAPPFVPHAAPHAAGGAAHPPTVPEEGPSSAAGGSDSQ